MATKYYTPKGRNYADWDRVKSNTFQDVIIYNKGSEIKYLGIGDSQRKFFNTEKEAALFADTDRIKNGLEPRNILKKK